MKQLRLGQESIIGASDYLCLESDKVNYVDGVWEYYRLATPNEVPNGSSNKNRSVVIIDELAKDILEREISLEKQRKI